MIGVIAHQRGQIKCNRKTGLPLAEQVVVTPVGFFRGGETGELAHGPELAAVHVAMNAAGVGKLARLCQIALVIEIFQISGPVNRLNWDSADGRTWTFKGRLHWIAAVALIVARRRNPLRPVVVILLCYGVPVLRAAANRERGCYGPASVG